MDVQINTICKTALFHLRNIARIRKFLSHRQCEILIRAVISSRLDYCRREGVSPGRQWFSHNYKCDVTSYTGDFRYGGLFILVR